MIRVEIPGYGDVEIKHVLFDYNGTLAVGGYVAAGVRESAIGIAVMGREGCAKSALDNADLLVGDILCALEMLIYPERLKATLRY